MRSFEVGLTGNQELVMQGGLQSLLAIYKVFYLGLLFYLKLLHICETIPANCNLGFQERKIFFTLKFFLCCSFVFSHFFLLNSLLCFPHFCFCISIQLFTSVGYLQ